MSRVILGFVVVAFSYAALGKPALPDYCEAKLLSPQLGPTGYQYRPEQRACEGTWDRRVQGSRALRIVSLFTSYQPDRRPAVSWPGALTRSTRILVQSLRDDIPYQLDSEWLPSDGVNFSWNGGVLRTLGLSGNDLGVLAYEEKTGGERLYIAVAARLPPPLRDELLPRNKPRLHITLLPPYAIRNVKLVIRKAGADPTIVGQEETAVGLTAGLPRTFVIPTPLPRGDYLLAISGELADSDSPVSLLARFRN